ncbi:unnamed protein product, partial [Hapterophycus canaliculatus]
QEDDTDVDHYFLPGGILDTHQEEDMIGGSLLDEIGGVGQVARQPPKQTPVSRVAGLEPRADPSTPTTGTRQPQRKPTSVTSGGPTRLSVEGTNPMAKEFTPSTCSMSSETKIETHSGNQSGNSSARFPASETPHRAFSPAVGSEVKTPAAEPPYRTAVQRQLRKLPRPPGPAPPPQGAAQSPLGNRGQHPRHHQGDPRKLWPVRAPAAPTASGPTLVSTQRLGVANPGHFSSPGFPQGMVHQRTPKIQVQESGVPPSPSQRTKRSVTTKHHSSISGQYADRPWDPDDRMTTFKSAGSQFAGIAHTARPQQRRNRKVAPQVRAHEQADHRIRTTRKSGNIGGRHALDDESGGRTPLVDQTETVPKASSRNTAEIGQPIIRRTSDATSHSPEQNAPTKVFSRLEDDLTDHTGQAPVDACIPVGGDYLQQVAILRLPMEPVDLALSVRPKPTSAEHSSSAHHQGPRVGHVASNDPDSSHASANSDRFQHTSSSGIGNSNERSARQAKSEDEPPGHSHFNKEKDRTKMKKDDKVRAAPKQLLGTAGKEPGRAKSGIRRSFSQRLRLLGGYVRHVSLRAIAAIKQTIMRQINRLRLVRRLLTLVSFTASSGVTLLSMLIMSTSWLFMLGVRLHSLAVKELTGSVHVAVCFLFPYFFQYLVAAIDEWAPHWLPVCLWYSFLMQMFCTPSHQYKHSMSSQLVPALRAVLPVAFLCEVPSGRSYLLALGGSELLLLSFTLAAVRLRCVFSPIFLLSWSSQVFALATFGSTAVLQYGQVLVSLASLHAVSMVDVMLNSRFYNARYRAGMSLTHGFRAI